MNTARFFQLSDLFYSDYPANEFNQILDPKKNGRGYYGVTIIELYNLKFAIPLHSNINVKKGYKLREDKDTGQISGLDFEKAVILRKDEYIGSDYEVKPSKDYSTVNKNKNQINKKFKKYITEYIEAIEKNDQNIIRQRYRNTTLIYFHDLLIPLNTKQ
ncbi:hypothetical protein HT662_09170 [Ursidibacter maritimus]|uniref:Uncharacterized protein n=1 Tax=Ursidibacter maritimus TaxID=1331689 RepID=A0ABS6S606_9PAST|nr:hypothetical protein [Ursidibacter maritimus]KAE9540214.1 hypothetical protein A1D26_00570 [Ursidibacter maritimus]MBV6526657.1 hypothetical protein [Ursidibacter maritimus]MBV6528619.1 hypothetical protein [Ursidibacter maritimus]MBV6530973.1 hypothetical protein [Ursidibacter maritimus]MBV6534662.1 hypothetical protein [Ursidibacter maritimus]